MRSGGRKGAVTATVTAWLGGAVACVETGPRTQPGPAVRPATCEPMAPVPYSGQAAIPSEDTAAPGPYLWKNVVIKGGGFVSGIITSPTLPGLVYARTDVGGAYRHDPANGRWRPLTDWAGREDENLTGIESIATDPVDPNRVYLAAGQYLTAGNGWILSSTDMGQTWSRHPISAPMGGNVNGRSMGERLAVDPNLPSTLYFASRTTGLWKSTDSAQTWSGVSGFPSVGSGDCNHDPRRPCGLTFVLLDPGSGSPGSPTPVLYVGVGVAGVVGSMPEPALYRSTNAGTTWEPIPGQPLGMMPHHAVLDGCGNLYLAYNNWAGPNDITSGTVWRFGTGSGEWTEVRPPGQGGGFGGISADAHHGGTLIVTTINRWGSDEIYRTTDGGVTWAAIGRSARRDDGGAKWIYWHGARPSAEGWMGDVEIDPFDPARALYVTGQGIWSTGDLTAADTGAQTTWRFDNDGLEETVPLDLVSPPEGAPLLSGLGDLGGFRHDDLDVSPPRGVYSNPVFGNTNSLDFAEAAPDIVARVGTSSSADGPRGAYSVDGGTTWAPFAGRPPVVMMGDMAPPVPQSGTIAVSADGATFVWAPQGTRTMPIVAAFSRDRGATWTSSAGLPEGTPWVASDRVNPSRFYASAEGRMYVSTDGGATFVQAGTVPSGKPRPVFRVEGDLWVASNSGVFHSRDSGTTWAQAPQIGSATAMGFGQSAPGNSYPAVYLAGTVNGVSGVYRSDDTGTTWTQITDPHHQFGHVNCLTGDPRRYGRVYFGTDGRGILYGDPR